VSHPIEVLYSLSYLFHVLRTDGVADHTGIVTQLIRGRMAEYGTDAASPSCASDPSVMSIASLVHRDTPIARTVFAETRRLCPLPTWIATHACWSHLRTFWSLDAPVKYLLLLSHACSDEEFDEGSPSEVNFLQQLGRLDELRARDECDTCARISGILKKHVKDTDRDQDIACSIVLKGRWWFKAHVRH
jgi:hypothetical protein